MTNLEQKARELRLPMTSTPENLESRFLTDASVLTFGNKILFAGYSYQGRGENSYYGAVYTFTKGEFKGKEMPTFHCEDEIKLVAISDEYFEDNGHAMAWAMSI